MTRNVDIHIEHAEDEINPNLYIGGSYNILTREEIVRVRDVCNRYLEDPTAIRLDNLEKFQKHIERQMQACLRDLNGGMQPGDKVSLDSRVSEMERILKDYPLPTLYKRQVSYRQESLESNSKLIKELAELKERITALESMHNRIPKDPENYFRIDLGHPFQPFYIRKPEGAQ